MKFSKGNESIGTPADSQLVIRAEDAFKVASLLLDQYKMPTTPIREVAINGMEAHEEAGVDKPVEIHLDYKETSDGHVVFGDIGDSHFEDGGLIKIIDHGNGMTEDFVRTKFIGLGFSTKDQDDQHVGGFGIGSKSLLSISPNAVWETTTKDGITTTVIISENDMSYDVNVHAEKTGKPSGTTVTVHVDGNNMRYIKGNIGKMFLDYADPTKVKLIVNEEECQVGIHNVGDIPVGSVRRLNVSGLSVEGADVVVLSRGNVPYFHRVTGGKFWDKVFSHVKYKGDGNIVKYVEGKPVVRLDLDRKFINPNRESLKVSTELDRLIIESFDGSNIKNAQKLERKAIKSQTRDEWIKNFKSILRFIDKHKDEHGFFIPQKPFGIVLKPGMKTMDVFNSTLSCPTKNGVISTHYRNDFFTVLVDGRFESERIEEFRKENGDDVAAALGVSGYADLRNKDILNIIPDSFDIRTPQQALKELLGINLVRASTIRGRASRMGKKILDKKNSGLKKNAIVPLGIFTVDSEGKSIYQALEGNPRDVMADLEKSGITTIFALSQESHFYKCRNNKEEMPDPKLLETMKKMGAVFVTNNEPMSRDTHLRLRHMGISCKEFWTRDAYSFNYDMTNEIAEIVASQEGIAEKFKISDEVLCFLINIPERLYWNKYKFAQFKNSQGVTIADFILGSIDPLVAKSIIRVRERLSEMGVNNPVEDFSLIEDSKLTSVDSAVFFAQTETENMSPIEARNAMSRSLPHPWERYEGFDVIERLSSAISAVKVNEHMTVRDLLDKAFMIVKMAS